MNNILVNFKTGLSWMIQVIGALGILWILMVWVFLLTDWFMRIAKHIAGGG